MMKLWKVYGLYFAWIVAVVATLGSLYFSEIKHFVPCTLCWMQRIFMYPLVIVLGIATYRQDRKIVYYTLPLSIIGGLIALWHVLIQKVDALKIMGQCKVGVPCNVDYINWLGFITIPILSLTAFCLITIFLWLARKRG
ncbi:disulfide bond formation protein DsbB [Seinonella peptonophila]|uniref:Disulfide bond formation protein DsbB n=1 Tax=Seinonella peptonophila TaxID=112248 RepID=A0A1M4U6B2_9BACL|nr:disulfide oxidoreductase [Seinonella peptonophila]SHE52235.1 disulfide bond formation protein DsbB [Seinonella peptonophila]